MSDIFQFKQFSVAQEDCAMKVGTDAMLLGAWMDMAGKQRVLDVGTGTGVLALMLAQRYHDLQVMAIELDPKAAAQAKANYATSPWAERIEVQCQDFLKLEVQAPFDAFISNPPYFAAQNPTHKAQRDNARQQGKLALFTLFDKAAKLAATNAVMGVVYPFDQRAEMLLAAWQNGWYLRRSVEVYPSENVPPKRVLMAFARDFGLTDPAETLIVRNADGSFHPDYVVLTKAFHLDF